MIRKVKRIQNGRCAEHPSETLVTTLTRTHCKKCVELQKGRTAARKSEVKISEIEILKAMVRLTVEDYDRPEHEFDVNACSLCDVHEGLGECGKGGHGVCVDKKIAGEFLSSMGFEPDSFVLKYKQRLGSVSA